jgi:hypothetical protein
MLSVLEPPSTPVRSQDIPVAEPHRFRSSVFISSIEKNRSSSKRSDRAVEFQNLLARIEQSLRETGYLALRDIEILRAENLMILRGLVPSYYLKQMAQEIVRKAIGNLAIQNELDVVPRVFHPQLLDSIVENKHAS